MPTIQRRTPARPKTTSDPAAPRRGVPCTALCPCGRRVPGPAEHEGEFAICPDCMRWNRLQSSRELFQPWKP